MQEKKKSKLRVKLDFQIEKMKLIFLVAVIAVQSINEKDFKDYFKPSRVLKVLNRSVASGYSSSSTTNSYTCIHDYLYESTADAVHGIQEYASDASSLQLNSNRRLQTSSPSWNSIRIVPIYVGFSSLSITVSQFITTKLIPSAISKWQSLLSVNRVIGPLFAHRECNSYWTNSNGVPYLCAEFSQETLCESGALGDTTISFTSTYRNYLGVDLIYSNVNGKLIPSSVSGGNGLLNADLGLFITSVTSTECSSSSGVLAYASTCQRDQLDRPTFGRINFCPNNLDASNIDKLESQIAVAIHEIGHVLGFSSASFPLFRNIDDQSPLTARNINYPSVPSDEFWVSRTCNNVKVTSWISSQTTLGYSSTRGMTSSNCGTASKGAEECVLEIRTPRTTLAARSFFACDSLTGVELENQLTSACDLQGSHWEQRILNGEIMNSYMIHTAKISPITLGLLEDSGWYIANYSNADRFKKGLDWGFQQGCEFTKNKCLDTINSASPPHFYSQQKTLSSGTALCTLDRLAIAQVDLYKYSKPLPSQYQYYTDSFVGGSPNVFDYCPAVQGLSNRNCKRITDGVTYSSKFIFGETYGSSSACFLSTLVHTSYSSYSAGGAGCFEEICNKTQGALLVKIIGPGGIVSIVKCISEGQKISVIGYSGFLICPSYELVCLQESSPFYIPNKTEIKTYVWPSSIPRSTTPISSPSSTTKNDVSFALIVSGGVFIGLAILLSLKKFIQTQQTPTPLSPISSIPPPTVVASPPPMYAQQYLQQPAQQYGQQPQIVYVIQVPSTNNRR